MPKILKYDAFKGIPEGAVLVDRTTPFGNPFIIGKHGTREECISKFKELVLRDTKFQKKIRKELKGKDLICHCFPLPCHATIILEIANSEALF